MQNLPETPELLKLIRNADEQAIRERLDELDAERDGLKTLLRSLQARNRVRRPPKLEDARDG
jgi:hypothetical protein